MKRSKIAVMSVMAVVCLGFVTSIAEGIVIDFGPVYPAPGNNSYTGSGNGMGRAGGYDFAFSGIDLSQEQALYWGMSNLNLWNTPPTGLSMQSGSQILSSEVFGIWGDSQVSTTAWQWFGQSTIFPAATPPQLINTRLTVTIASGSGTWIQDATTQALDTAFAKPRALWNVTSNSFTANVLMEALSPLDNSTWQPYDDLCDALRLAGWQTRTNTDGSFSGAFYGTVPEPSTLVLLGVGAISLIAYAWRRRRS